MVEDYKAVKSSLNSVNNKKKGGGLTHLQISENEGTQTITEPGSMAETLRDFAVKHYKQANQTICRHGEGHNLITDKPMKNPVYDTFLDGTFMYTEHLPKCTYGQNLFINANPLTLAYMSAFHKTLAYMSAFHVMAFYTIKKWYESFYVVVFGFLAKNYRI